MLRKNSLLFVLMAVFVLMTSSCLFSQESGLKSLEPKASSQVIKNEDISETFPSFTDSFAVTYDFSGGRFGDNLLSYLHAKWISYKYNMLLLYKPFPYSDALVLSQKESKIGNYSYTHKENIFNKTIFQDAHFQGFRLSDLRPENSSGSILYVVPYFPESGCKRSCYTNGNDKWSYFDIDWKDQGFRSIVLKMLRPIKAIKLCHCPLDKIPVAVHARTGRGFDAEDCIRSAPNNVPPLEFYHEALISLINIYPDRELYFHIFTDDPEPNVIATDIENYIKNIATAPFSVHYRTSKNRQNLNVIEDFFSLFQFDCLIRPDSNFSRVPSLLKEYKVLIYPSDLEKLGDRNYIISKIDVVRNE